MQIDSFPEQRHSVFALEIEEDADDECEDVDD